ncbi:hypothetical protein Bpfe_003429 [Biomphalaria pfeifferi]|uniref:Uncharacterized protein n=1 Tax=Biomphalaria pfeifferi TaxID=112525 RepID=A0AAD8C6F0_BIOPF|nr:hypothetical protein Bpfe_003429 [Biomphalaria pfeifferi]
MTTKKHYSFSDKDSVTTRKHFSFRDKDSVTTRKHYSFRDKDSVTTRKHFLSLQSITTSVLLRICSRAERCGSYGKNTEFIKIAADNKFRAKTPQVN